MASFKRKAALQSILMFLMVRTGISDFSAAQQDNQQLNKNRLAVNNRQETTGNGTKVFQCYKCEPTEDDHYKCFNVDKNHDKVSCATSKKNDPEVCFTSVTKEDKYIIQRDCASESSIRETAYRDLYTCKTDLCNGNRKDIKTKVLQCYKCIQKEDQRRCKNLKKNHEVVNCPPSNNDRDPRICFTGINKHDDQKIYRGCYLTSRVNEEREKYPTINYHTCKTDLCNNNNGANKLMTQLVFVLLLCGLLLSMWFGINNSWR